MTDPLSFVKMIALCNVLMALLGVFIMPFVSKMPRPPRTAPFIIQVIVQLIAAIPSLYVLSL